MDRRTLGFGLLGVAVLLWVAIAGLQGGGDALSYAALIVMATGAFVAAAFHASRPVVGAAGLVIVAAGIILFYRGQVFGPFLASIAGGIFALGCLGAAPGVARSSRLWVLGGSGLGLVGACLWVVSDGLDAIEWQPGNLLAAAAWLLVATGRNRSA